MSYQPKDQAVKRHCWITYSGESVSVPEHITDSDEAMRWASDHTKSNIDPFAYSSGAYCNGPKCADCGREGCWHCNRSMIMEACPS